MQEWKSSATTLFSNARKYQADPPPPPPEASADPSKYPLRLVKVEYDLTPGVTGWKTLKIKLPTAVRSRHISDPVYGQEWKGLLEDFDRKPL